jgi:hypothetical protein
VGVAASRIETADTVATTKVTASVSTAGEAATTAWSTSSQSPSITVVTATTQPRIDTKVEQTSHRLWPFFIGVAIAAAGLILLSRRSLLRAR